MKPHRITTVETRLPCLPAGRRQPVPTRREQYPCYGHVLLFVLTGRFMLTVIIVSAHSKVLSNQSERFLFLRV